MVLSYSFFEAQMRWFMWDCLTSLTEFLLMCKTLMYQNRPHLRSGKESRLHLKDGFFCFSHLCSWHFLHRQRHQIVQLQYFPTEGHQSSQFPFPPQNALSGLSYNHNNRQSKSQKLSVPPFGVGKPGQRLVFEIQDLLDAKLRRCWKRSELDHREVYPRDEKRPFYFCQSISFFARFCLSNKYITKIRLNDTKM